MGLFVVPPRGRQLVVKAAEELRPAIDRDLRDKLNLAPPAIEAHDSAVGGFHAKSFSRSSIRLCKSDSSALSSTIRGFSMLTTPKRRERVTLWASVAGS